jgi:lysyl-tRNA synthetase class 1
VPISFSMLLTLVSSSNAENAETLWGFIRRYRPGVSPRTHPKLDALVGYAIHYFRDFVLPEKQYREPSDAERAALMDPARRALAAPRRGFRGRDPERRLRGRPARAIPGQDGKVKTKDGKPGVALEWFNMLYQVLLGQRKGPRFGSFVAVYGIDNTIGMIDGALARSG